MWIPRMTLTQRSHMLLYLMLAGDIHPHPGPRPRRRRARRKPKLPLCPTCSQKVGLTKSPIGCDQCHNWFHAKCAGVTSAAYQSLENDGDDGEWICCTCSLPFADSSRIDSGISSPDPPAPPTAQSTPIPKHTRRLTKHGTRLITTIIVNANSLKNKRCQLAALIKATSPHVLIITETKLAKKFSTSEFFDPEQFSVTRKDRNAKGGGVLVAISTDIDSYAVDIKCGSESVYVAIHSHNQPPVLVGAVYRPPDKKIDYMRNVIKDMKEAIKTVRPASIIIGGDYNLPRIDWEKMRIPPGTPHRKQAKLLLSELRSLNLQQMIKFPTRDDNILDLLLTDTPSLISESYSAPGLSDHHVVVVKHQLKATINKKAEREAPLYHKAKWEDMNDELKLFAKGYLESSPRERSITTNWASIKAAIHKAITNHVPHKKIGKRFNLPYMNRDIKRKINRRKRVHKRAVKYKRPADREMCKRLRKEINQDLDNSYTKYIQGMLDTEVDKPGAMKKLYRFVKSLGQDSFGVSTLRTGGRVHATAKEKADACNQQFHSVFSKEGDELPPPPPGPSVPDMPSITVTHKGVLDLLRAVVPGKASGPDNIPARVLKECAESLAPVLTDFFQQSLDESRVPDDWKQQYVHPIFKKGSKSDPANYRPVALTCLLSKMLEHIIASSIHKHLESHSFLAAVQHGFRKYRSCETQLTTVISDFVNWMNQKKIIDAIVLDFSKAFDKVPHDMLLTKLAHAGITGSTRRWIRHWLKGRKQHVVIDGEMSEPCDVSSGVPQGSVLGPLLFLIFINDIALGLNSTVRLFADDAILYRPVSSPDDHRLLQEDLLILSRWADTWCMEFNTGKCYVLHIQTKSQKKDNVSIPYTMNEVELKRVSDTAYLGVNINEHLSWEPHISNVIARAEGKLAFLERNLKGCPQDLKETAYTSIVRSGLEYASAIWDPPHKSNARKKLERVQRKAARFVTGNPQKRHADHLPDRDYNYVSVDGLIERLEWPSLESRRRSARCTLVYKIRTGLVAVDPALLPPSANKKTRAGKRNEFLPVRSSSGACGRPHRQSLFPRTVSDWNSLPLSAKKAVDLEGFKAAISQ